jgi:hypothetical protein
MRTSLLLCSMLAGACLFGSQNQGSKPRSTSSNDSLNSADPYCYACMVSPFRACHYGVGFPHLFDKISEMGDGVSIAIAKQHDLEELATPENTRAYLCLVRIAFSDRDGISQNEDRNPNITMLLLNYLQTKQSHDVKLEKDIEDMKKYVDARTVDPPVGR